MPVSKKPRRKPPSATQAEAPADHALPDRRAMESYLATVSVRENGLHLAGEHHQRRQAARRPFIHRRPVPQQCASPS